jgi:hypothetical protein
MMMTSIPGYSLPALPASNYNYGARPATTANPEYGSAWKTAVTTPISNSPSQTNNTLSNLTQTYNPTSYDGRSYSPSYTDNSQKTARQDTTYNNNLTQTYTPTSYDGRSYSPTYTDNSRYAYNPTANTSIDNSRYTYNPQTATQNTQYNNEINQKLQQYLNQNLTNNTANTANIALDNRQLSQAEYTQNNTANTANIDYNNLLAYYNPVTNSYNFPPVPQQPSYPPVTNYPPVTPTPEKPPEKKGSFPWLPVGLGVAGLAAAAFFIFGKKKDKPPVETPPHETPPHETPPHETPPHETPPHETPSTRRANGGVFDDPKYYQGTRDNIFENHTTGNLTYFNDSSDKVSSTIKVAKSKVEEKGTGKQLTFVEEFKFQNNGKTVKVTNTQVHIGGKSYRIKGQGSADLGKDGTVSWNNGTVTITTAEGKHVIKTHKFQMEANKRAYGPAYLEIDSTSNSKQLDVAGVVGDGMNAQLAGLGSPSKALRSFENFQGGVSPAALTQDEMENLLRRSPSSEHSRNNRTSETYVASNAVADDSQDA